MLSASTERAHGRFVVRRALVLPRNLNAARWPLRIVRYPNKNAISDFCDPSPRASRDQDLAESTPIFDRISIAP
jgi:hypothetical protein